MTVRTVFEIEIELLSPASVPDTAMGFDGEIGPRKIVNVDQVVPSSSSSWERPQSRKIVNVDQVVPLSRTHAGDPYVPCSSLVGSLRSHLMGSGTASDNSDSLDVDLLGSRQHGADAHLEQQLDGKASEDGEPGEGLTPSALRFLGCWVESSTWEETGGASNPSDPGLGGGEASAGISTHVRTRTSIDRNRGAPYDKHLWSEELLMPPARIILVGLADIDLSDYWKYVKTWRPRVGGMRSSGFGESRISSIRYGTVDMGTPDGRGGWLKSVSRVDSHTNGRERFTAFFTHQEAVKEDPAEIEPDLRSRRLIVDLDFEIVDELLIDGIEDVDQGRGRRKDDDRNRGDGTTIYKSNRRPDGHVWIEGTSWKGLFRSRCEFILKSLDVDVCSPYHTNDDEPLGQRTAEDTPCECLICEMFGSPSVRGSLEFCSSKILEHKDRVLTRTSVDRITGGAAEGRLFTIEGITGGTVGLRVYWTKCEQIPDAVSALLEAVVCDIHDGFVGIGALTSRGFGTLRLSRACDRPELANIAELL